MPIKPENGLNVIVLGASGAVGGETLTRLLQMPEINTIDLLLRRSLVSTSKAREHLVDVLDPASYGHLLKGHDAAICTFGVGQPTKVSLEEFTRIDKQAVLDFARACRNAGVQHFALLGSVAADPSSRSFYLRSKGELSDAIKALGFERFSLFQPSVILTPANRYGISQGVLLKFWPMLSPLLVGGLGKYRGIRVETLGAAIARNTVKPGTGFKILHHSEIEAVAAV